MIKLLISYARQDGSMAAAALREKLERSGYTVWQDIAEMRGGQAWRQQLFDALNAVDAVLLLLTPGAMASNTVQWEWQTALMLQKKLLPLWIKPCQLPPELSQLQYHDLQDLKSAGYDHLIRDLRELETTRAQSETRAQTIYVVNRAQDSAVGNRAFVDNTGQGLSRPTYPQSPPNSGRTTHYEVNDSERTAVGDEATVVNPVKGQAVSEQQLHDHFVQLTQLLATQQQTTVRQITEALEQTKPIESDIADMLEIIWDKVEELQANPLLALDPAQWTQIENTTQLIRQPELSAHHRLKVAIPIIPLLVSYESEINLGQSSDLLGLWDKLKGLV